MAGLRQTKRVSWPTDGNLCKVRLFLSEDAPSLSGLGTQDHLQAKAAWLLHAEGRVESDDSLPPGFEAHRKFQHPKIEISQIPLIRWQCPPRLVLNPEWLVVAGEESKEMSTEGQRQSGVLEAVYPRPSSIPPNPLVAPDVQAAHGDDSCAPLIPITAIEDEDGTENLDTPPNQAHVQLHNFPNAGALHNSVPNMRFTSKELQGQFNAMPSVANQSQSEQPSSSLSSVTQTAGAAFVAEPDVLAAASAAFTAMMKTSEEGSLIDRDLLIKILNDPVMMQRLLSEYGAPKQTYPPPAPPQSTVAPSRPLAQPVISTTGGAPLRPPLQPIVSTTKGAPLRPPLQPIVSTTMGAPQRPPSQPIVSTTMGAPQRPPSQPIVSTTMGAQLRPPPCHISVGGPIPAAQTAHMFSMPNHVPPQALNPHNPAALHLPVRAPAPPSRDVNYYKSLIQLHGGEKQEAPGINSVHFINHSMDPMVPELPRVSNSMDPAVVLGSTNQRDLKGKVMKPCAFFNTPRGCRHGASCLFQHDASSIPQRIEQQKGPTTKRIKLDGGVFGRN